MSVNLNPREVLSYLNELGYVNITAEQLKRFIKDLKKLIKYDQRQAQYSNATESQYSISRNYSEIFSTLHAAETVASRAKHAPKKTNVITVEVRRPRKEISKFTVHHNEQCKENIKPEELDSEGQQCVCQKNCCCKSSHTTDSSADPLPKQTSEKLSEKPTSSKTNVKSKASYIRPRLEVKPSKSDPVSLYHWYQSEWKKIKFPGEDNRAELRWAIREKMLGNPSSNVISAATSMETIKRKRNRV